MEKFLGVNNLRKFAKNRCILQRSHELEICFDYEMVLKEVDELMGLFQLQKVPQFVGIAFQAVGHTPGSCVILLSILNHQCHFYPVALTTSKVETVSQLLKSGSSYLITNQSHDVKAVLMCKFNVFREEFGLYSLGNSAQPLVKLNDLCYTISTTGTTGTPKMVLVPYACIASNVNALSKRFELSCQDIIFLSAPLTFDPFVIELFLALRNGAALLVVPKETRLSPNKLLPLLFPKACVQRGVTLLQMTPNLFRTFGHDAIRDVVLNTNSPLRILLLGGEEFPPLKEVNSWLPQQKDNNKEALKTRIFNIYGITEVSCWSTIHECDLKRAPLELQKLEEHFAPLGSAIDAGTQLRLVNDKGEIVEGVGQGELQLGSSIRKCYIPQTDNVAFAEEDGVLFRATGDMVRRDEDGQYYFVCRINNSIKRMGKLVCLDALDKKIAKILGRHAQQVACLWKEDAQQLICCIATEEVKRTSIFMERLESHEKPDRLIYLKKMPLNEHGKLARAEILDSVEFRTKPKRPVEMLTNFLREILALDLCAFEAVDTNKECPTPKRLKQDCSLSFTAAGGTSFHALSLSTEIGDLLESVADERKLLDMLLDDSITLACLVDFLEKVETKTSKRMPSTACLLPRKNIKLEWRVDFGKCVDSPPAVVRIGDSSYVCVGAHSHLLRTIDAGSGQVVGNVELPDRIMCKVEWATLEREEQPLALVGCHDGNLYGIDCLKNRIKWSVNVGESIKAKPLVIDGIIVVASYAEGNNLWCLPLNCPDKQPYWSMKIGGVGIFASPILIAPKSLLVCCLSGVYARISVYTGDVEWTWKCESPIFSTPAVICDGRLIVIGEVSGRIHVCAALSGEILHTFKADGSVFSCFTTFTCAEAEDNEVLIIFGCQDAHVYCLKYKSNSENYNKGSLDLLWKSKFNAAVFATPLLFNCDTPGPYIVACSIKGLLAVVELSTGNLVTSYDLQADVYCPPCQVLGNKICFGCRDNFLYCFSVES